MWATESWSSSPMASLDDKPVLWLSHPNKSFLFKSRRCDVVCYKKISWAPCNTNFAVAVYFSLPKFERFQHLPPPFIFASFISHFLFLQKMESFSAAPVVESGFSFRFSPFHFLYNFSIHGKNKTLLFFNNTFTKHSKKPEKNLLIPGIFNHIDQKEIKQNSYFTCFNAIDLLMSITDTYSRQQKVSSITFFLCI